MSVFPPFFVKVFKASISPDEGEFNSFRIIKFCLENLDKFKLLMSEEIFHLETPFLKNYFLGSHKWKGH